jgi:hypothetical protein
MYGRGIFVFENLKNGKIHYIIYLQSEARTATLKELQNRICFCPQVRLAFAWSIKLYQKNE